MKRILFLFIILSLHFSLKSQDLIVTAKGDSLNCKITQVQDSIIYFILRQKGENRNTHTHINQVKTYQYNYFKIPEVSKEIPEVPKEIPEVPKDKTPAGSYSKLRISMMGGLSFLIAPISDKIPADFVPYVKELKSGKGFGIDVNFFLSENYGLGIKYSLFRTKNQMDNIYVTYPNGQTKYGSMEDDISINYYGPAFYTRLVFPNNNAYFISSVSLGYLTYKNNAKLIDDFLITGNTLGLSASIGVDYSFDKNLAIGLELAIIFGSLSQYEIDDGAIKQIIKLEPKEYENLSRVDITVGIKFYN